MPSIVILPDRFSAAWDGSPAFTDSKGRALRTFRAGDCVTGLESTYHTDAHFVPYHLVDARQSTPLPLREVPRLKKGAARTLEGLGVLVRFDLIVFDVDDPIAHAENKRREHAGDPQRVPASPEWRREVCSALGGLPGAVSTRLGWYETRGGYRLLWGLPYAVDASTYAAIYLRMLTFFTAHGITADPSCKDWTRLYRCPRVLRDGYIQDRPCSVRGLVWPLAPDFLAHLATHYPEAAPGRGDGSDPLDGIDRVGPGGQIAIPDRITERRNVALTSIAGRLRNMGADGAEILATLTTINDRRCDPPLDDEEVRKIAESIATYAAPAMAGTNTEGAAKVLPPAPLIEEEVRFALGSEVEIADEVAKTLESGRPPLVYDRSTLWRYAPPRGLWERVPPETVQNLIGGFDGEWVRTGTNPDGSPKVQRLRVSHRLQKDVSSVLHTRRSVPGFFDEAPGGLTFANGFVSVDANGPHVWPLDPAQRSTTSIPFVFASGYKPKRFLAFLNDCFQDVSDAEQRIQILREFMGACLIGRATAYQKAIILVGEGANGKSTFQKIVSVLFPSETLTSIPPQLWGQEYRRAKFATSRLNVVSELPEADILQSEPVKGILDGSRIEGRKIRGDPFEFSPICGHLISANNLPHVRDMSRGFFRRFILVVWPREFEEHEQDRNLAKEIITSELAEIAGWLLDGVANLERRGFYDVPISSSVALEDWKQNANPVAHFVAEACEIPSSDDLRQWTGAETLYQVFRGWSDRFGSGQKLSARRFWERLRKMGIEQGRDSGGSKYKLRTKSVQLVSPLHTGRTGGHEPTSTPLVISKG